MYVSSNSTSYDIKKGLFFFTTGTFYINNLTVVIVLKHVLKPIHKVLYACFLHTGEHPTEFAVISFILLRKSKREPLD